MKTQMNLKISGTVLAGAMLLFSACQPTQMKPPFDYDHVRQDSKVDNLKIKADDPLNIIGATALWKKGFTGKTVDGARIRIAVVGSGIDYTIPDLRDALWVNTGELDEKLRSNGLDNDGNGYINDTFGYDFYSGDNMPYDWHGHDTYIASIIAATGKTNPNVVGVAPNAELVTARYIGSDGTGNGFDAVEAMEYAMTVNAKLIYFEWPQGGFNAPQTSLVINEFKKAGEKNILVVLPAGNSANESVPALIKTAATLNNVVVVAGLGADGKMNSTSNYGKNLATIAAPSVNAKAYLPGGEVSSDISTTSVAAAYVVGAAALITTMPGMNTAEKVKNELLSRGVAHSRDGSSLDVLSEGSLYIGNF